MVTFFYVWLPSFMYSSMQKGEMSFNELYGITVIILRSITYITVAIKYSNNISVICLS